MPFTTRPTVTGWHGMAASTHWLASGTANSVLERGGNAFDAAVAAGFVLHVAEPHLNGPGGDMVALVTTADTPEPVVLVGQGPAPAGATIAAFRERGLTHVPGAGALAAAVPASVETWFHLLEHYGTWRLSDVLGYAAEYAERGIECGEQLSAVIATMAGHFTAHWPTSHDVWLPDGAPPAPGDLVRNPAYAGVLRRLSDAGSTGTRTEGIDRARRLWRREIAAAIVDFTSKPHRHSDGGHHAGVLTTSDFQNLRIATEAPLRLPFRGFDVVKAGFWSSGPVLLQALGILDRAAGTRSIDPDTGEGVHTIIETIKLAMADREAYYGDARPDQRLLTHLLSAEYCTARAGAITDQAATDVEPGGLPGIRPYRPRTTSAPLDVVGTGEPTVSRTGETRGDTCHLDVVDRFGNMISATPSGGWLQSSPAVPGLGFCLGTRLQMTWLDEDSPSALRPGTRPRTTLSPTMVLQAGVPVTSLGTPGGDQQDQWQLLYLLRTIVGGMTPQQAIDAPMFHTTAFPGSFVPRTASERGVVVEDRAGAEVIDGLRDRGHDVTVTDGWSLGRLSMVGRDRVTGWLCAAANPRGGTGYAVGR
ncbi:gamma-glutamyltransferase family protein [Mycolicibacterium smegmatis]|uniref:Transferase n=1 Tax=Mycolicibacterium smegmatis (strain MKD8) TaxID=1214915 RepID=A0A2U9PHH9_MYCSE|nr:gamma-glutamyltransferase [Mycolicibacterium smegmatis]AWT51180.1 transferase [Mycolicibacterium smegmatis MKD8]